MFVAAHAVLTCHMLLEIYLPSRTVALELEATEGPGRLVKTELLLDPGLGGT